MDTICKISSNVCERPSVDESFQCLYEMQSSLNAKVCLLAQQRAAPHCSAEHSDPDEQLQQMQMMLEHKTMQLARRIAEETLEAPVPNCEE